MRFKITDNPDGSITVDDYPLMATLEAGEKDLPAPVDTAWIDAAIAEVKSMNRSVFLFDGHNEIKDGKVTRYAPIVGRGEAADLYRDGEIAKVRKMRVADPRYITMFKRDLIGNHSGEFLFNTKRILGVAHLGGMPGHQDAKLPELRAMARDAALDAELAALADGKDPIITGHLPAKETHMFTDEQKAELKTMVADALKAALPDALKTLKSDGGEMFANDFNDKLQSAIDKRDKARDLEDCRKRHVLLLSAKDNALWKESALTDYFSKCETVREIEAEYKRLSLINSKTEAVLTLQHDDDLASPDYRLRKEARESFSRRKDDPEFKKLYASEDVYVSEYVAANKDAA